MESIKEHMEARFHGMTNITLHPPLPASLNVELNDTCNHKCVFCPFHGPYAPKLTPHVMDFELVKKILVQAKELGIGRKELGFYFAGEVFLYKKFVEVVRFAKELGFSYTFITTNGALAKPELMKQVIDAGLDSIRFSVNAIDRETYKKIHGRDDFDTVLNNIKFTHSYLKNIDRHVNTSLSYVVTKINRGGGTDKIKKIFEPLVDEILFIPVMHLKRLDANLDREYSFLEKPAEKRQTICPLIFNTMYITANAEVKFCCILYTNQFYVADLKENLDLRAAWENPIFQKYRQAFLNGDLSGTLCENCYL